MKEIFKKKSQCELKNSVQCGQGQHDPDHWGSPLGGCNSPSSHHLCKWCTEEIKRKKELTPNDI